MAQHHPFQQHSSISNTLNNNISKTSTQCWSKHNQNQLSIVGHPVKAEKQEQNCLQRFAKKEGAMTSLQIVRIREPPMLNPLQVHKNIYTKTRARVFRYCIMCVL